MYKTNQLDAKIPKWFAIYTRPKAEKKVKEQLLKINIGTYLPLKKELRQWKDRKKWIETPLFSSYIFVKIIANEYYIIPRNIIGFVKYVSIGGNLIAVRNEEIETVKKLLEYSSNNIEATNKIIKLGTEVEIISGQLKGLRGKLLNYSGLHKIAINIETIGSILTVKIDKNLVRKVKILNKKTNT